MSRDPAVDELVQRYVEHHVVHGERLPLEELCAARPELQPPLRACIERYHRIDRTITAGGAAGSAEPERTREALPAFEGFQTVERIGRGGMGEVFKARDLRLDRFVAAKVLRGDSAAAEAYGDFLREARAMALFRDDRIVQIHDYRPEADPPVILMEYVEGFALNRVAPSLEHRQRARILLSICEAVQHAHDLGIQHRDLKPSNILLDSRLSPKILDFGLSGQAPDQGHFVGTVAYMAPEQLDSSRSIDGRSDVYALGVILYELLCGERPYRGETTQELIRAAGSQRPELPLEIDPSVPEPLQAIALKAMERDPDRRYATAREMAQDLRRWLEGRPVLARPSIYASALARLVAPHKEAIRDWLRLKLIYPHEAGRLEQAYRHLEQREDDWIIESRVLSYSQIALYLGGFLLICGGLLYFGAHRFFDAVEGVSGPLVFLGLPFLGLNAAAHLLYRREYRAVAVAFYLGSALLLPMFLLILFHEAGWLAAPPEAVDDQLFGEQGVSNRQLQLATLLAAGWAWWQASRTRTVGLSSLFTLLLALFALAVLTDHGLQDWLIEGRWDLLALHLVPLLAATIVLAAWHQRRRESWFGRPLFVGAAVVLIVILELLAQDGRALGYLGVSMQGLQDSGVSDPNLIDTLTAMTLSGIVFLVVGSLLETRGSAPMRPAAWLLVVLSPFAILKPVGWLVATGDYWLRYDWFYLALSLVIAVLSRHRQRKSFYIAGLISTGTALWLITDHNEWFDRPLWAVAVIAVGLAVLAAGFGLHLRDRTRRNQG